jgi:ketosteroid isomerase-like protein
LNNASNEALLSADWKTVERIHANDLVFTNADGSVTHKADLVDSIRSGDMKFESIEMSDVKVQALGNVAVVTGRVVERGRYKTDDLSGTYRFTDVWAKQDGSWQMVIGHETKTLNSQFDTKARSRLIGTWRLVSAGTFRRDGGFEPYPEYGPDPIGYLIYDPTGHKCVSLSNPNHPHWVDSEKPTDGEKLHSYNAFFAYCGSYRGCPPITFTSLRRLMHSRSGNTRQAIPKRLPHWSSTSTRAR